MKRKKILYLAAILSAALLAAGCQNETASSVPGEDETYSQEVASLGVSNRFAGVVCASGETKVEKEEGKEIAKILVEPGEDITKGQVLFKYDSEQASMNYDKAKMELEQLQLTLQSGYEQKASLEYEKSQADASEQLSYSIQIMEVDTNIRETEYNLKLKDAEVAKLEKGLKKLKVKSPIDGKVQSINTESTVDASGQPLPFMVLMNTGTYRVKAYINELNAMELYEGAEVIVRSRVDDSTWTGHVATVDFDNPLSSQQGYDMGEGSSDVGTSSKYPFYVELDSADGLILGQHVFVEVLNVEFTAPVEEDTEEGGEEDDEFGGAGPIAIDDISDDEDMGDFDISMDDYDLGGDTYDADIEMDDKEGMEENLDNGPLISSVDEIGPAQEEVGDVYDK